MSETSKVSEEIAAVNAKYNRIERHKDKLGREIGVKRLKPSQQAAIRELAPSLADGAAINPFMLAAMVCEIDGQEIPFSRGRMALDAIMDRLDDEGLEAAAEALAKFVPRPGTEAKAADTPESDALKNS